MYIRDLITVTKIPCDLITETKLPCDRFTVTKFPMTKFPVTKLPTFALHFRNGEKHTNCYLNDLASHVLLMKSNIAINGHLHKPRDITQHFISSET